MKRYCCGFLFNDEMTKVALILKNRPTWQAGYYNGIGGLIEEGEYSGYAMIREFYEETGVVTNYSTWHKVLTLYFSNSEIDFYASNNSELLNSVKSKTDEIVCVVEVNNLPKVVENIPLLLGLSIQCLKDEKDKMPISIKNLINL